MPAPYSYDFRKKAIEAYKRGERKIDICRLLKISRNTLDLWLKKEEKTGNFRADKMGNKTPQKKIEDEEGFRKFIQEHGGKTQKEMAKIWPGNVSQQTLSKTLKKLGISRKKKLRISRKRRKQTPRVFEVTQSDRSQKEDICR